MEQFNYETFITVLETVEEQYKDTNPSFTGFNLDDRHFETFIFTVNEYQTLVDEGETTVGYAEWLAEYVKNAILAYSKWFN